MKILIADKLSDTAMQALSRLGAEVDSQPELKSEDIAGVIGDRDVLIVRSTKVTAGIIDAARNLALIVRAGAGVNTIDIKAASSRGIYVANCPAKNSDAVAELAIGLLIAADRRIVDATLSLRDGRWEKKTFANAHGLKGRTLGIIGLGAIGRAVARRALGLEMKVIAWSRSLTAEAAETMGIVKADSPLQVAAESDAVTLHIAAKPDTKHMVNAEFLDAMKPGGILINTSRGEIIHTASLIRAIREKGLRVGLDVYEDEPAAGDKVFAGTDLAGLISCTPHIAASTSQAADAIAMEAVRVVESFSKTGLPVNCVNICAQVPAISNLVVRHFNRVGVLASILDALREDGVNVEEMRNVIFDGGNAACCTLQIDSNPSGETLSKIKAAANIIHVQLQPKG